MSSPTSAPEKPLLDDEWSGSYPDAPQLHLAGFEDDEDTADPHICRGID